MGTNLDKVAKPDWFYTNKNEFPEIGKRVITSIGEIGHFNANYKFINEITGIVSTDKIIWCNFPIFKSNKNN